MEVDYIRGTHPSFMPVYAILGGAISPTEFVAKCTPHLSNLIEKRDTSFILSDEPGRPLLAIKFLNGRGFRNCTIYHVGKTPRHTIGKYPTKGTYISYGEVEAALREDADEVILLE